ncbi:InlB B-repeat-containing protein [Pontibacter sp. E15-1]|uniref:InlB B-repeat-containing protein n=1 Tax=Pontibacter sp. E15-1 TaxID=2919918 RepID=UPI001F4F3E02|nr:InlB B-repeat-containing protein [Pontibacter sp. E15-1]MCJ8164146.1 InlB B-repeat-containing protein [Pontibacter sp. E15-1]
MLAPPAMGYSPTVWSGDASAADNPLAVSIKRDKAFSSPLAAAFQTTEDLVSGVAASSGRSYALGQLAVGVAHYTDRAYIVTSVPTALAGAAMVRTANDDKKSTAAALLSFQLSAPATLYVAYDPRATALPAWMSGWLKLPDQVGVNDSKIGHMSLYSKAFPAGSVSLGGNLQAPASGAENNYFVLAKAVDQAAQYTLTVSAGAGGTVARSPDQPAYDGGTSVTLTATPDQGYVFTGWSGDASGTTNPLAVTMNRDKAVSATFAQQTADLVSGVAASSGRSYALGQLAVGVAHYTDRAYIVTSVPTALAGAAIVRTANDDKRSTAAALLSFQLSAPTTLYVAYDPRAIALPAWMSGWLKLPDQVGVNDSKIGHMSLYSKAFPAGSVSLGGNLQAPASGAENNYFVLAKAVDQAAQYTLTVSAGAGGTVARSPDQPAYDGGTSVTLTATPDQGYVFTGWSGDASGTTNPLAVTMNRDKAVSATFAQQTADLVSGVAASSGRSYALGQLAVGVAHYTDRTYTVKSVPSSLSGATLIRTANDDKKSTAAALLSFDLSEAATVYVAYDPRGSTLPAWLSGWQKLTEQVGVNDAKISSMILYSKSFGVGRVSLGGNLQAPASGAENNYFVLAKASGQSAQYTLAVSAGAGGTVSLSPQKSTYTYGETVTLTATPEQGFGFSGWTGDTATVTNPLVLRVTSNMSLSAGFTAGQYTVTATATTGGSVSLVPEKTSYTFGDTITLTATPEQGYTFGGWSGDTVSTENPLTLYVSGDVNLSAGFEATAPANVALTLTTSGNGSVARSPELSSYPAGSQVTLTATPAQGYAFSGWSGDTTATANPLTLTMDADKALTATFTPAQYTVSATAGIGGAVSLVPEKTGYAEGDTITLTAIPEQGYSFNGWTGDTATTLNPLTLIVSGNLALTAGFSMQRELLLFTPTSTTITLSLGQQKELKVNLNNSDEDPVMVQLTAYESDSTSVPAWLRYEGKTLSAANNNTYNLGSTGNEVLFTVDANALQGGTYTATVKATAAGYTSATLFITLEVSSYEEGLRPYVTAVRPEDNEISVSLSQSVSVDVTYPSGKSLDGNTVNPTTVKLYRIEGTQRTELSGTAVNSTAAGDAITLSAALALNTTYEFSITDQVKDGNGYKMVPFTSRFTTVSSIDDTPTDLTGVAFQEQILIDNTFGSDGFTSLVIGPDRRLYAATSGGKIERWRILEDGTLSEHETISPFGASRRLLIGFRFDPAATATNLIAWISHSSPEFVSAPEWSGQVSRIDLSSPTAPVVEDYIVNLPRSLKDHATNGIDFGPDGALYFVQGGNTAMGAPDAAWGYRPERLLSGAVLRLDIALAQQQVLPIDAKTEEGGTYNPYAPGAPLTIYASGIRNAYDLVWHSNGQLYVPANGSAAGGNAPALTSGDTWSNGEVYTGPNVPAMNDIRDTQSDYLFRVLKDGYYGHPNVLRHEYILNGGNPTAEVDPGEITWMQNGNQFGYPVGTQPEPNYRGWAYDFGLNKSPNGVIEYKSDAFSGKLKGKLLVCRFSGGDDIMVLEPGTSVLDIIRATEGAAVPGLRRPFANPLDVIEDTQTGNLYISEYFDGNGDGQPRITLLRTTNTTPPILTNRVNAGGVDYVDSQTRTWSSDTGFSGGLTSSKSFDVSGTVDDPLYLKYRYASSRQPFFYSLHVSPGTYTVKLHFIEPYFGAPGGKAGAAGKRVFHVEMEGKRVLTNFDIFAQGGAATAVVKTFENVDVSDGILSLEFISVTDNAIISAIEIVDPSTVQNYALTLTTSGSGTVSRSPELSAYPAGSQVTLTATPAQGYTFSGWSGNTTATANPLTLTMDADKALTATFAPAQYTVSAIAGTGGAVSLVPEKTAYAYGDTITLTAIPEQGYTFSGWSGDTVSTENPLTLYVSGDVNLSAAFSAAQYTVAATASTGGTVNVLPEKAAYTYGDTITLTATPEQGYSFSGWSGDTVSTQNPISLYVFRNLSVSAAFSADSTVAPAGLSATSTATSGGITGQSAAHDETRLLITVYPNPMRGENGKAVLANFGKQELVTITVYSAVGETVYTTSTKTDDLGAASTEIVFSTHLSKGVYFIRAVSAKGTTQTKLLIE